MSYIVQAASLSSLISAAADPPLDPRGDISKPPEPLVLYIARVPGTKDVFLSPIKPRAKVVSAEDIHSSLYFLHAHGPEDRKLSSPRFEEPQESRQRRQSENINSRSTLPPPPPKHRYIQSAETLVFSDPFKPPAERPWNRYSREERARSLSPAHQNRNGYQNGLHDKALRRKPVGQSAPLTIRPNQSAIFNSQAGSYFRYSPPKSTLSGSPPYPVDEVFPNVDHWRPQRPSKMPYESDLLYGLEAVQSISQPISVMDVQTKPTPPTSPGMPVGWFTLIRRDPATGQQWNVAKLHSSHKSHPYEPGKSVPCLDITVETPGYAKFVNSRRGSGMDRSSSTLNVDNTNGPASPLFQRELFIENLQDAVSFSHSRSKSDDSPHVQDYSIRPPNPSRLSIPAESTSTLNLFSNRYNNGASRPNKRKTGLKFLSPWNGICEFSTTMSNSLKCKHILGPSLLSSESSQPVAVSELRFNLPSSNFPELKTHHSNMAQLHLPMPDGPVPSNPLTSEPTVSLSLPKRSRLFLAKIKNRSNKFDPFKRRQSEPTTPSSPLAHESPVGEIGTTINKKSTAPAVGGSVLDLSLGQERAGGGSSGTQAKMGKLIIEPEGMKMLDLVVAANLGIWWRAYDKDHAMS